MHLIISKSDDHTMTSLILRGLSEIIKLMLNALLQHSSSLTGVTSQASSHYTPLDQVVDQMNVTIELSNEGLTIHFEITYSFDNC